MTYCLLNSLCLTDVLLKHFELKLRSDQINNSKCAFIKATGKSLQQKKAQVLLSLENVMFHVKKVSVEGNQ